MLDLPVAGDARHRVAFTSGIEVATHVGVYLIREVKRSGKRVAQGGVEFLRGFPLPVGSRLN